MIKSGTYIKAIKASAVDDPACPTADSEEFEVGEYVPGQSPPNGLEMTGVLMDIPKKGKHLLITTDSMDGKPYKDVWVTSQITEVINLGESTIEVRTLNSVYLLIETIPEIKTGIYGDN